MFKIDRRNFIAASSLALYPSLVFGEKQKEKGQKSVVWIWLGGGIANQEFSNPIDGPKEYASVNGWVDTKSDFRLGGNFSNLSKLSNDMVVVRNLKHKDGNHNSATHWMNTSVANFTGGEDGPQKEPSFGSMISYHTGTNNSLGIPTYVKLNKIRHDGPAWLGAKYTGFLSDEQSIRNMNLGLPRDRIDRRMSMVRLVDKQDFEMERKWTALREEAYNISVGKASEAFKIELESIDIQNKYELGKSGFGKSLLMTRRLLQNGVKWINITNDGWDFHQDIAKNFNTKSPELDRLLYIFIEDLRKNNLLENTLVVIASEFSRTKINIQSGRDHNPNSIPLLMLGGPCNGRVIGQTSKDGLESENPYSPDDLWWTIGNFLEIPKSYTIVSSDKRPHHIFHDSAKDILL